MERKTLLIGFLIITLSCITILFLSCAKDESKQKAKNINLNETVPVSVTTVDIKSFGSKKTFAGSLEGIKQSKLVSKISERIISINTKVGDFVKAGDVVIQLDRTGPASQYLQAEANLNNAERELNRMKALFQEGAIARQNVDQVQTAYDIAKANFDAAKSAVELASPISGRITAININPGDWVTPGSELAVVADINQMIIKFNISEMEVQDFKIGTQVFVYSEFNKELTQRGKITEISRSASLDARSFQVKAQFQNTKDNFFKPGMFVKVDVTLQWKDKVLAIPTASIIHQSNEDLVFTIKNNLSFSRKIKTGLSNEDLTEIVSGLNKGDMIVTAGMNNLSDSTKVTIVK